MNTIDLSFYLEPPSLTEEGTLEIIPLAPLSMVSAQPGTYFRTESTPPLQMVYGMLENAFGWHFTETIRKDVLKGLAKKAKKIYRKDAEWKDHAWLSGKPATVSKSKFFSLLQFHLLLQAAEMPAEAVHYDDLWTMHLHANNTSYPGGSRNYDYRLEALVTKLRTKTEDKDQRYELGDRAGFERIPLEEVYHTEQRKIHVNSLRPGYPLYYGSPKKRGFVVANGSYRMPFKTTPGVKRLLERYADDSQAPLYLGTNEGWVHYKVTDHV